MWQGEVSPTSSRAERQASKVTGKSVYLWSFLIINFIVGRWKRLHVRILVLCSFLLDKMHHFSWTFGEALDIDKLGGTGYLDPRPMRLTEPRNGGGGRDLCFPLPPRAGCPAPRAGSFGRTPRKSPPKLCSLCQGCGTAQHKWSTLWRPDRLCCTTPVYISLFGFVAFRKILLKCLK